MLPTSKTEEYRYSTVVDQLANIDKATSNCAKFDITTKGDYEFFGDSLGTKSFQDLPKNYHRHQNYFKELSLSKNENFHEITCDKSETIINFASSQNSILMDKIYIHTPSDKVAKIYINFHSQEGSFSMPMVFIDAQDNTHVEIVYTVDSANNSGIVAPLFELIAQEKSHVSLQSFTSGVKCHRLNFIGFCAGDNSHIDLRTGFHLQKDETSDLFVRIYHEAKDSTSNQMIKSVALDSSQMNFNGLIYANGEAHNIYAYQMLKGMILGEKARIFARPQLDIEYFELACSHGVSIGGFDPEELFYLQSRGIKLEDVYPLLLYGFFSESFIDIPLEEYWITRIKNILKIGI